MVLANDKRAWDALVERYSPLIWSICRRHRLGDADARAVNQSIWRQLVNQLDEVQDPGALAGWLAAAARRKCGNARSAAGGLQIAGDIAGAGHQPPHQAGTAEQERLVAERHAALREAFSRLSPGCQRLLTLLILTVSSIRVPFRLLAAEAARYLSGKPTIQHHDGDADH